MLSQSIQKALNEQINAELQAAYLYLSMSLDAESSAFPGVAKWFWIQWLEEQDHARMLEAYMIQRGAKVSLLPIANVRTRWNSPVEMFNDALSHEIIITHMIHSLYREAQEEGDLATLERLQWFISEQVREENSARCIHDLLSEAACRCGGPDSRIAQCAFNLHLIDKELGMRVYRKPPALE